MRIGTHLHTQLISLDAKTRVEVKDGEGLPSRLVLFPLGAHDTAKGKLIVNAVTGATLPGNQRKSNFDTIALDFNHNTVKGSEAYQGEPAKIAANARVTFSAREGIVAEGIEWTKEGKDFVGGKHYIDLSPTVLVNKAGEVVFIHSAAVCRQGAVPGLTLFSADALPAGLISQNSMDPKKLLCALVGCDETASDTEIEQAASTLADKLKTMNAEPEKVQMAEAGIALLDKTIKALSAKVDGLTASSESKERADLIGLAASEGKVIPKELLEGDGKLATAQLKVLVASLPVTVPLDQRVTLGAESPKSGVLITNSADEQVRKTLGITKEDWDKANAV